MKWSGLILIAIVVAAVLSAGCTEKGIILNFSSNNTTSNTSSSSISDENLTNITENISPIPHDDDQGIPEEPEEPEP